MKMRLDTLKNKLKKQKGFTLLELLAVLIIIAILGMGLYFTLARVQASSDANTEGKHIDLVTSAVKQLYAGSNNFTKVTTAYVVQSGAVPADLLSGGGSTTSTGTTINNKWNGTITVTPTTVGGATIDNAFTITDTQVPQDVCVKLATNTGNNYLVVTVNGTSIRAYGDVTAIDPTAAVQQCQSSTTNNTLAFTSQ
jgi:prepilin-type N-terminal cleavage/methylation domain-containing protein